VAAPAHHDDVSSASRRFPDNRIHRRRVHDAHFSVRPAAGHGARRGFGDELGGPIESREENRTSVVGTYLLRDHREGVGAVRPGELHRRRDCRRRGRGTVSAITTLKRFFMRVMVPSLQLQDTQAFQPLHRFRQRPSISGPPLTISIGHIVTMRTPVTLEASRPHSPRLHTQQLLHPCPTRQRTAWSSPDT